MEAMGFGDGGGSPEPIQGRSGRLWVPNKDSSKWSCHLYRIYATDGAKRVHAQEQRIKW